MSPHGDTDVLRVRDVGLPALTALLGPAGLRIARVDDDAPIPGSHWGDDEAGLIGDALYVRADTPVHSALHEGGHWLMMDEARRARLHTDAGGTAVEESAVCCLQILLADRVAGMDRARMLADMDRWGYSFRLGSTAAWFERDADDARALLRRERRGSKPRWARSTRTMRAPPEVRQRSRPSPSPIFTGDSAPSASFHSHGCSNSAMTVEPMLKRPISSPRCRTMRSSPL